LFHQIQKSNKDEHENTQFHQIGGLLETIIKQQHQNINPPFSFLQQTLNFHITKQKNKRSPFLFASTNPELSIKATKEKTRSDETHIIKIQSLNNSGKRVTLFKSS